MIRNRVTWLSYLMLAFYGYFLNVFGPITPYLKSELQLSYTVSSLHFSAFALGMIFAGLLGHAVVQRTGRWVALWISAFGISIGSLILIAGHKAVITITASFLMGLVGSLVLTVVPSVLADQHGEFRTLALSEANVAASILSAVAPILVGWFALTVFGWRMAIVVAVAAVVVTRFAFGTLALPPVKASAASGNTSRSLPLLYWIYWAAIFAAVSVEFCMIFWSADYLETSLGMAKADAARAVSLFLGGMILGRLAGSRFGSRVNVHLYVTASVLVAAVGFLVYWMAPKPLFGMLGLFITGLGVASLYPMILSLAIGSAGSSTVQASAFSSLASGAAILLLPLILGRLADSLGIHAAYLVVPLLLAIAFVIIQATVRLARIDPHRVPTS
ncbi:MAG TPA: MFS transporter [Anaerolineales bacterium]|nr:MFS transporter [Anaerolineales bacterium]